jgi:hypothetical protein
VAAEVAAVDNKKDIEVEDRDGMVEENAGSVDRVEAVFLAVIEAEHSVMVALEARESFAPSAPFPSFPQPFHFPLLSFSKST